MSFFFFFVLLSENQTKPPHQLELTTFQSQSSTGNETRSTQLEALTLCFILGRSTRVDVRGAERSTPLALTKHKHYERGTHTQTHLPKSTWQEREQKLESTRITSRSYDQATLLASFH